MYPNYLQYQPPNDGALFVNGIAEADSWVVQRGQSVRLFDRNQNTFYVKSVADNGMPNPLEIYDYTKREMKAPKETFVTREEFEELQKMVKEIHDESV